MLDKQPAIEPQTDAAPVAKSDAQTSAPTSAPPGGGRWRWDADAAEWVSNEQQDAPSTLS